MKVPLLDLKAQHDPIQKEILDAIAGVLQSQAFILGPEVKKLEDRIASYSHTQFAIGVSSGTDAL
jgi:dTDP-4-amino-4,6-dideoxygalactose transaminase